MPTSYLRYVAVATAMAGMLGHPRAALAEPGDNLTVSALTFGPGDHPFFKFGHNALLVQQANGPGWVFNFGTFAFDSPALVPKFLRGSFKYWLSVSSIEETVASYAAANRSILAQELDLSPAQRWAMFQALRENAKPEYREYLYDYFYDNCSTRVRDAIDRVVDGRVRAAGQAPAPMTFRAHALRMVADLPWEYVALYIGLGRAADIPISRWDESFLPERLADLLRATRLPDGKPLVRLELVLNHAARAAKPAAPPSWAIYFLGAGLVLGGLLFVLGRLARRSTVARITLGFCTSLLGGIFGLIGLALLMLWLFTNHRAAYANANIMQLAPWAVVLVGWGIGIARGRPGSAKKARIVVIPALCLSLLGIVAKALPGANQDNWPLILLLLPVWSGLAASINSLPRPAK